MTNSCPYNFRSRRSILENLESSIFDHLENNEVSGIDIAFIPDTNLMIALMRIIRLQIRMIIVLMRVEVTMI